MSSLIILSLLGLGGLALLGGIINGEDQFSPSPDDETDPEDDTNPSPDVPDDGNDIIHAVQRGTDGDDQIRLSADSDNPIMAIGGDGADTFTAEYPHAFDDERPYDVIIADFHPEEDVLTFEIVTDNMSPTAVAPQDFELEPAEDGSYTDVRVSVFDPENGPDSARDFVVRLDGLADVDPSAIVFADTIDDTATVIEGDVGTLDERGSREDDHIIVRHSSGSVIVSGGAGEDTIDAREFQRSDDARLRIDGSEGNDTYLFAQGINVSDDQYGGSDLYSMTVNPDTMESQSPSTVIWDYEDRFEIVLPPELADQVRIENQPAHFDASLGATVQRDDVFVGDVLVMRMVNLDEEHRITLDSPAFSIVSPANAE